MNEIQEAVSRLHCLIREFEHEKQPVFIRDLKLLLAEHLADDNEPITREWFRSMSKHNNRWMLGGSDIDISIEADCNISVYVFGNGFRLCHIKTRGDVRRLCQALGIVIRETANDGTT